MLTQNICHSPVSDDHLAFARDDAAIAAEAAARRHVLRTSVPAETLDATATVRAYKSLAQVERAFRSLKTVDLDIRPVFHWTAPRVRAHVLLCLLTSASGPRPPAVRRPRSRRRRGWARLSRGQAQPSAAAERKAKAKFTDYGMPVHSFRSLLADLASLTRNTVRFGRNHTIEILATPTERRAFDLLALKPAP